jgi:hypothetical protein
MSIKEMLYYTDGSKKTVAFTHYFDGNLWYQTQDGFSFPVPISDVGTATFKATDSAPLFMRYIRKQLAMLENAYAR